MTVSHHLNHCVKGVDFYDSLNRRPCPIFSLNPNSVLIFRSRCRVRADFRHSFIGHEREAVQLCRGRILWQESSDNGWHRRFANEMTGESPVRHASLRAARGEVAGLRMVEKFEGFSSGGKQFGDVGSQQERQICDFFFL